MLTGKHLIAGERFGADATFTSEPARGSSHDFSVGTAALVDTAVEAAEAACASFGWSSRAERAALLRKIAEEINTQGDALTEIGTQETGLPEARLQGERGRTVGQLRLFADHIEAGDSMVHGGPYPASTNFGATSVGTLSIRCFLRPVCYQDIPTDLLPEKL